MRACQILLLGLILSLSFTVTQARTLTYAMYGDIKDWDPAIAFSLEVLMLANVYEPLLWYNPNAQEGQFTPALATEWTVSDDGLRWTFQLRDGVRFHDGTPFTAEAAKASLDRTRAMKQGAWYIWESVQTIEAPAPLELVITTKTPQPIDLIASSQYGSYIYSPTAAAKGSEWFNRGNAVGTGPYEVRQWSQNQQVVLEANEHYWRGWDANQYDRVILRVVTENATQVQMLLSGEADFISLVPADIVKRVNAEEGLSAYAVPSWKNSQFLINTQKYPTDNKQFRQALTHLWDYETVVNQVYDGYASVAVGPIPKTMWGHNNDLGTVAFDPLRAAELLQASGVPKSDWKVSMAYIGTDEAYKNAALLFQAHAAQIGLEVELLPGEWGVIWNRAKNLNTAPNLQSMTWWPTYPTPSDWLIGMFRTEQNTLFNLSHYTNPEYDRLVTKGAALEGVDREAAIENYKQAQRILTEDAVAIFYADIQSRIARASKVGGVTENPAYNAVFFYDLYEQ
ncbi:ABC transporter substrate-binding protein [Marinobacter sp. X15-166B]|uniref:ABC transporter substrate-binding protein n=1 Tax=Marinobacter sp. X15-166B TaxID=1897620 RepID=UPI00085C78D2|nr:ABC transporter substrate-binding protein [Marinobacter sp. X15-166B]OEY67481.1 peptide ABC transporter substrate-binding protein [Marinobacter sp. X15-166B]